jgi:hypothetical protein
MASNMQGKVGLLLSFRLRYFLCPFEHFLEKELSQIFAPIPGGGHVTIKRVVQLLLVVPAMWRFTPAYLIATPLKL